MNTTPRHDMRRVIVAYANLLALRERRVGLTLGKGWRYNCRTPGHNDFTAARQHLARVVTLYGARTPGRCKSLTDINNIVI